MLEVTGTSERLENLLSQLESEIDILQVEKRIRGRVKRQMEKSQREYYLNEQVKAIQKELGEGEEGADLEEMEKKIRRAHMPKEARKKAEAELKNDLDHDRERQGADDRQVPQALQADVEADVGGPVGLRRRLRSGGAR